MTVFHIKHFYLSMSKYLLQKAFDFAKAKVFTTQEELLFFILENLFLLKTKKHGWKKGGDLFDVTMVPYDDPKICELVGLFILYKFQKLNKINSFGLLQRWRASSSSEF